MAIEGPLRELGIHDVFQLLDLSRKTGALRVASALRDNEGTVLFRCGRVVSATIRSNPHPLGSLLLKAGRITDDELARARTAQAAAGDDRRLGEILVSFGVITARELERHVRRQVEVVVFELMSWQEGYFSFAEMDLEAEPIDATTSVTTESLLMEGARRIDEWERIRCRIAHLGVIPVLADVDAEHPSALDLRPNEWEVLAAVDGTSDLRGVAAALGRSEFEVARIAFGLVATGIIRVEEPAALPAAPPTAPHLATLLNDAREALREGRPGDALSFAATAVAIAPDDPEARVLLARALNHAGRDREGDEELRRALQLEPRFLPALMESARVSARRGEFTEAIAFWRRVIVAAPSSPVAIQARDAIANAVRLSAVLEAVDA